MKTHQLARVLSELAGVLRKLPNVELSQLPDCLSGSSVGQRDTEFAVTLDALVALARVDKQRWHEFIIEHSFPIEVRPRDASRDILGKLLKHLEANPKSLQRLKERSMGPIEPSNELLQAFETLLRDRQ